MAYSVSQRTVGGRRSHGTRLNSTGVLRLVIGQSGCLISVDIALGLVGAFALARVLKKMLFGVYTSDNATFAGAALLLARFAVVASVIPALRVARVDIMLRPGAGKRRDIRDCWKTG